MAFSANNPDGMFDTVPENVTSQEQSFELDPQEYLETNTEEVAPIANLIFQEGETNVPELKLASEALEGFDEQEETDHDPYFQTLQEVIKSLSVRMENVGIKYRREWSTIIQRTFHKGEFTMRESHLDMFVLGVLSERNLNIEKEIKDTSTHLTEEVNKLSGVQKALNDIRVKLNADLDNKMKQMDSKIKDMEKLASAMNEDNRSVSSKSSYPGDLNLSEVPESSSAGRMRGKPRRDYGRFLLKLGFSEKHIQHENMRKYQDSVITPDMYDVVMSDDAFSDELKKEFYNQILEGVAARLNAKKPVVETTYSPAPSANKYEYRF